VAARVVERAAVVMAGERAAEATGVGLVAGEEVARAVARAAA
jgi:hypothetical protein